MDCHPFYFNILWVSERDYKWFHNCESWENEYPSGLNHCSVLGELVMDYSDDEVSILADDLHFTFGESKDSIIRRYR